MMAMMLVASATSFAGDSDALKAVTKSKNYAEAAQLLKQNIDQMTDAAEKAKAYNHLVDLAMKKVTKETGIILENQVGQQMGRAANETSSPMPRVRLLLSLPRRTLSASGPTASTWSTSDRKRLTRRPRTTP